MIRKTIVRTVISFLSVLCISSCSEQDNPEFLEQQIKLVNDGLEELIQEGATRVAVIASETKKMKPVNDDLGFYYKNTRLMIEEPNSTKDSIRFWRLTKSKESARYSYAPNLDSNLVFGQDTLIRKLALLNNMYHYLEHVYQSYSYCGIMFGTRPAIDTSRSDMIYFYGKPYPYSALDLMIKYSEPASAIPDSLPLWGKLQIMDRSNWLHTN